MFVLLLTRPMQLSLTSTKLCVVRIRSRAERPIDKKQYSIMYLDTTSEMILRLLTDFWDRKLVMEKAT